MKIVAAIAARGYVGKTTLSANLAESMAMAGDRLLAVDLDPQNALRLQLPMLPENTSGHARAALARQTWHHDMYQGRSRVLVMPFGCLNDSDRAAFEAHLLADPSWLHRQFAVVGLGPDDVVVLDTPPWPSPYMRQAQSCAQLYLVVSLPDAASYATLPLTDDLIQTYCEDVVQVLRAQLGERNLSLIHQDQAVAHDRSVLEYNSQRAATQDLQRSAAWVRETLIAYREAA